MARTSSKAKKIAATVGVALAGLSIGPIAAFLMVTHLESTGALESEWGLGYLFTHIGPSFVIGVIVGCSAALYFARRIWR